MHKILRSIIMSGKFPLTLPLPYICFRVPYVFFVMTNLFIVLRLLSLYLLFSNTVFHLMHHIF